MGKNTGFVGHDPMPMEVTGLLTETGTGREASSEKHFEAACVTLDAIYRLTGNWNLVMNMDVPEQACLSRLIEPQRASQVAGTDEAEALVKIDEIVDHAVFFTNIVMYNYPQFADTALKGLRNLATLLRYHIPTHPALDRLDEYFGTHAQDKERHAFH